MKIALISDLHGFLPYIDRNDVDSVLIAGDICPDYDINGQRIWCEHRFYPWLNTLPSTVWTAGNHDFYFESIGGHHGYDKLGDYSVYKFPYVTCAGWAFHKKEKETELLLTCEKKFDIMLCHAPPFGICDTADFPPGENCGSKAILKFVEKNKPKLCVFGHIHEAYGMKWYNDTLFVNAAFKDVRYKPRMKYLVLDTNDMSINFVPCEEWM